MKYLLSSATLLLALLGMTLTGCATTPALSPTEKKNATKTVKVDVAPQTARTEQKPPLKTLPLARAAFGENSTAKNVVTASPRNTWQVSVVQNAIAVENNHEKVSLKKAPFTIRVTFITPQPVRFHTSPVKQNLTTSHVGKKLSKLCSPVNLTPFCLGRGIPYADNNHNLSLEKLSHHYFFYRKNINLPWMKVKISPQQTTLEWTIQTINNKPVASYKGTEIYMTLWVDSVNRSVFDEGELKQVALSFLP